MFNKNKQKQLSSLSSLKRNDEYKDISNMQLTYAVRYCFKHRKELHTKEDVKKCFDEAIACYKTNKLEVDNA